VKLEFRTSFAKDLNSVRDKATARRVRELIEEIEGAESLNEVSNIKKLKGRGNYYRIRMGDYRLGIALEGEYAVFVRFLHRKDIYRYFP
jgi:mRNA interferase RelE/StbE